MVLHELCDNKRNTVTFIKIKGTEEIIGGYNPIIWSSSSSGAWGKINSSFIYSFKIKDNFIKDTIISNVKDTDYALRYHNLSGPCFGWDSNIWSTYESTDYDTIYCKKNYYEKKIRDTDDRFSIEDYEVFQIVK